MRCRALSVWLGCVLVLGMGMWTMPDGAYSLPQDAAGVTLSRVARITPEASGNYWFVRVAAPPDDVRHVMVCTLHMSPVTNENSAELFGSADGGETWSLRVRDGSSSMVSEDACAFGEAGKAYFVAQPWSIKNPYAAPDSLEQNEMHLYRSPSYGDNWPAFRTSTFVDYAQIAVDSSPNSPFRGRAYIVGNKTAMEEFPLIAVLDGGRRLIPARQGEALKNSHGGKYPRSLIVLRNGDVLASYLYSGNGSTKKLSAVVTVTRDGGRTVDGPIRIEEDICGATGSPSIAENPRSGAIIAFYGLKSGSLCLPTLASSEDGGQTWKREPLLLGGVVKPSKNGISQSCNVAFRTDGIALLTWIADKSVRGALFGASWQLLWEGEISSSSTGKGINVAPYVRRDVRLEGGPESDMDISLQFGFTNYGEAAVAVQADGGFLIVWREGDGQLYSRSVHTALPVASNALKVVADRDVTALVRYAASNITFDENTATFGYDLELVNASDAPLRGPFLLKVTNIATTIGLVTLKDVHAGEIVFIPQRAEILLPGEHTHVVRIQIQAHEGLKEIMSPSNDSPRVGIMGRVYARTVGAPNLRSTPAR